MKDPAEVETRRRRFVLAGLLAVTCFFGTRDIGNEASVMLGGDMARYVMNGVFVHDLIADGAVTSYDALARYAERYYAKYPALSLGHHPPITYFSAVPFYWIFGVSLFAARIAALFWFLLAAWGLFAVTMRLFNWQVAGWAAVLFVTNLVVLRAGQYLLSEMPMTALLLWAVYALLRFCEDPKAWRFLWFIAVAAASLYAKQLAVLMFPVYGVILLAFVGWRRLFTGRALTAIGVVLALSIPIAIMTVRLAPENFEFALANAAALFGGSRTTPMNQIVASIISSHLSIPTLVITIASVVLLVVRRRRRVLIGLAWIGCVFAGSVVFAGTVESARYAFGAMPAYFLLIAGLANEAKTKSAKATAAALLTAALWWQVWTVRDVVPSGAGGYEEAAQYVLAQNDRPAILYDSAVDTGYFIFFMRKGDPQGRQIVLRADKLVGAGSGNPEVDRKDLHSILQKLGVRWIVVEERRTGMPVLRTFHEEFRGPRFVERHRIPVVSTATSGLSLLIFEYLDAQAPDYDAEVSIDIPLGRRGFAFRLGDLVDPERR